MYLLGSSPAAALPNGLFEHSARVLSRGATRVDHGISSVPKEFSRSLPALIQYAGMFCCLEYLIAARTMESEIKEFLSSLPLLMEKLPDRLPSLDGW
jgi:hypothetical protein